MAKDDTWRSAVEDAVSKRDVRKPGLQRESMAPKKPLPPPDKNKQPARPGFDHQQVSQRLRAKAVAHKIAAHGLHPDHPQAQALIHDQNVSREHVKAWHERITKTTPTPSHKNIIAHGPPGHREIID